MQEAGRSLHDIAVAEDRLAAKAAAYSVFYTVFRRLQRPRRILVTYNMILVLVPEASILLRGNSASSRKRLPLAGRQKATSSQ